MSDLLSVDDALGRILRVLTRLPVEQVPLEMAHQRVLAVDVFAPHDLPAFANSSMDGFAVRSSDVSGASPEHAIRLAVVMDIPAGALPQGEVLPGQCARIMTGAPIPPGSDAVVPVEQTDAAWQADGEATLPSTVGIREGVPTGANIRFAGADVEAGARILRAGTHIRAAEMGVLAGFGISMVDCVRQPRVAILSSGDELIAPDAPLTPGKVRDINSYTLAALVHESGGVAIRIPTAQDDLREVRARFQQAVDIQPDVILSSAGVSVGTADLIRTVLAEMGEIGFWRINLRPGKPLAFGSLRGIPFFGLPGNPVSAMVTFDVFVRPSLLQLQGADDLSQVTQAVAGEDIPSDGRQTYVRVKLVREQGNLVARTTGTQSSSAITSMAEADGLLIIPEGVRLAAAGETYSVRILRA
jgi:molybdopterin molybdotransferase